jgi:hypothetical protein
MLKSSQCSEKNGALFILVAVWRVDWKEDKIGDRETC